MELRHLRSFVAVAEEQHFGRAAMRLAIVQPALTRQIQELEQELGVSLFDRSGRNVLLTNAGRTLLHDTQRILADLARAQHHAQMAAQGQLGTLAVSFLPGFTDQGILPVVLAQFRKQAPDVELQLRVLPSHEQWSVLRSRDINIGFVYFLPSNFPQLQTLLIAKTRVLLALPKGHRLERRPKIFLRDLHDEPFVFLQRPTSVAYYDHMVHACHRGGLTMRIVTEVPTEGMLMALTAGGAGVSFMVDSGRTYPSVMLRAVQDLNVELRAHAIWRKDDRSPILQKFLSVVRAVVDQQQRPKRPSSRRAR
jgi:DNA-binding transcriptional LysR family regulator